MAKLENWDILMRYSRKLKRAEAQREAAIRRALSAARSISNWTGRVKYYEAQMQAIKESEAKGEPFRKPRQPKRITKGMRKLEPNI